jgi:protein PsiE
MSSARVATLNRLTKRTDTDEPQPRDTISTLHGAPPVKYEGTLRKRIKERLEQIIETAELIGLLVTGIGTALAMGQLMFLYLEVFAMVGQYLKAGQLPVRFPLYIAMVSIARDVILRAGTNTNLHLVASAGAIVLIALGVLLIRYGQSKYPSHTNERPEDGGH